MNAGWAMKELTEKMRTAARAEGKKPLSLPQGTLESVNGEEWPVFHDGNYDRLGKVHFPPGCAPKDGDVIELQVPATDGPVAKKFRITRRFYTLSGPAVLVMPPEFGGA